jgi:adenylosuccinate synthase
VSLEFFKKPGKASLVLDGQWGSTGKGAAVAFTATHLARRNDMFDIVTTNNGPNSGHTSVHDGEKRVLFHLPTASMFPVNGVQPLTYLNAGAVIDPDILIEELKQYPHVLRNFAIHPNAALITQSCKDAEMREDSAQTKIASTRKGVGEAIARKVLRSGLVASELEKYNSGLQRYIRRIDLIEAMLRGLSVLVEVPQGHSLSLDGPFYPHTTSRNCTVMQAMSDAGIHPNFYYASMLVIRTFPIRVGNIVRDSFNPNHEVEFAQLGYSGGHFPDQEEVTWEALGVTPEITTVTKRVRRVFTFSEQQVAEAIAQTRPSVIFLSFCDYVPRREIVRFMVQRIKELSKKHGLRNLYPEILTQWGPTTADVIRGEDV